MVRESCPPEWPQLRKPRPLRHFVPQPLPSLSQRGLLTLALTIVGSGACSSSPPALVRGAPATRHTSDNWCASQLGIPIPKRDGRPACLLQAVAPSPNHTGELAAGWSGWGSGPLAALVLKLALRRTDWGRTASESLASVLRRWSVGSGHRPMALALGSHRNQQASAAAQRFRPSRPLSRAVEGRPAGRPG